MLQLWKISAFFREHNIVITDQTEGQNYKKQARVVINPTFSRYQSEFILWAATCYFVLLYA